MKLEVHRGKKVTETDFSGKVAFCPNLGKMSQNAPKMAFLTIFQILFVSFCCKWSMKLENDKGKRLKAFMWLIVAYSRFFEVKKSKSKSQKVKKSKSQKVGGPMLL